MEWKEPPKLLYRFSNKKIKPKETIERLSNRNKIIIIKDPRDMAELLNDKFQQVFTRDLTNHKKTSYKFISQKSQ